MLSNINWKKIFSYLFVITGWSLAPFLALTVGPSDGVHIRSEVIENFLNNPSFRNGELAFAYILGAAVLSAPVILLGYAGWALGGLSSGKRLTIVGFILMIILIVTTFLPSNI
ncbi:MAG: hypothetical protein OEV42_03935 [Deltaproteobacteria bacterium]|nr:hypothetical protein [Deltaproteobacteria bacterium]